LAATAAASAGSTAHGAFRICGVIDVSVNITEDEGDAVDVFVCTECAAVKNRRTSWKLKCVYPPCKNYMRTGSQYCSDACGMTVAKRRLRAVFLRDGETNLVALQNTVSPLDSHPFQQVLKRLDGEEEELRGKLAVLERRRARIDDVVRFANDRAICGFDDRLMIADFDAMEWALLPTSANDAIPETVCGEDRAHCAKHVNVVQPYGKSKFNHTTALWAQIMLHCLNQGCEDLTHRLDAVKNQAKLYADQNAWRGQNVLHLCVDDPTLQASMVIMHPLDPHEGDDDGVIHCLTVASTVKTGL
jgi:hypothetical protein